MGGKKPFERVGIREKGGKLETFFSPRDGKKIQFASIFGLKHRRHFRADGCISITNAFTGHFAFSALRVSSLFCEGYNNWRQTPKGRDNVTYPYAYVVYITFHVLLTSLFFAFCRCRRYHTLCIMR